MIVSYCITFPLKITTSVEIIYLLLVDCVRVYQQVESLSTQESSLSSVDIIKFLSLLKDSRIKCAALKTWYLSGNPIDDKGINAIIESMPNLFPSLRQVFVEDNPAVSTDMKAKLRDALKASCKVCTYNLFLFTITLSIYTGQ